MSDNDERILNKLDAIEAHMSSIDITLAKQEVSLSEHMKRSDALEELVATVQEKEIEPLKTSLNQLKGAYKFIIFISVLAGIAAAIAKVLGN